MNISNPFRGLFRRSDTRGAAQAAPMTPPGSPSASHGSLQTPTSPPYPRPGQGAAMTPPGSPAASQGSPQPLTSPPYPRPRHEQGADIPHQMGETGPVASVHPPLQESNSALGRNVARGYARLGSTGAGVVSGAAAGLEKAGAFAAEALNSVALGVGSLTGMVSMGSAYNASKREWALRDVQRSAHGFQCDHGGEEHRKVVEEFLPYAVNQMEKRQQRKLKSSVPGVGIAEGTYRIGKHYKKKWAPKDGLPENALGAKRDRMADEFAKHWVGHHCELSDAAAEALLGNKLMRKARTLDSDAAKEVLKDRLKPN